MATITLELPDTTPVMSIIQFANSLGCEPQLAGANHFRFKSREQSASAGRVVAFRLAKAEINAQPTPSGAA
jgi:hypothetical protein